MACRSRITIVGIGMFLSMWLVEYQSVLFDREKSMTRICVQGSNAATDRLAHFQS